MISVPLMIVGHGLMIRRGLGFSLDRYWWQLGAFAFLLLVSIGLNRRGSYRRDQRIVWLNWLALVLWYELTIAFIVRGASNQIFAVLYSVGFFLALAAVYFSRKISDPPAT